MKKIKPSEYVTSSTPAAKTEVELLSYIRNHLNRMEATQSRIAIMLSNMESSLDLIGSYLKPKPAVKFGIDVMSEPLSVTMAPGETMPTTQFPIDPNSRAVAVIVPLSAVGVPTALDGDLVVTFPIPAQYQLDNTDPLRYILKCNPPADLDAQPSTVAILTDSQDSDPTVEVEFNWQKAVVTVKATQFSVEVSSEPL